MLLCSSPDPLTQNPLARNSPADATYHGKQKRTADSAPRLAPQRHRHALPRPLRHMRPGVWHHRDNVSRASYTTYRPGPAQWWPQLSAAEEANQLHPAGFLARFSGPTLPGESDAVVVRHGLEKTRVTTRFGRTRWTRSPAAP